MLEERARCLARRGLSAEAVSAGVWFRWLEDSRAERTGEKKVLLVLC